MSGLAGLMMMMATTSPAQAADMDQKQFGLSPDTYSQVISRASDAADNGVIDGDFDSTVKKEYEEIAAASQNLYIAAKKGEDEAKPYLAHYIKPAHVYITSLKDPDTKWSSEHTKAVHIFAMAKLNQDTAKENIPKKAQRSQKPQEYKTGNRGMKLRALAMNIKSAEVKTPEHATKAQDAFNLAVDEAASAGFVDEAQATKLKQLGAAGDAVGVDQLVKQIEASKK